jgi:hypothetical protein
MHDEKRFTNNKSYKKKKMAMEWACVWIPIVFIHIYPVSEGYLRKIPVERRGKYPEPV